MSGDTRLNNISTLWSVVRLAHEDQGEAGRSARQKLLERYTSAIHRYLLGAVRDENTADELTSDFAYRFLHGGLKGVDPTRGRFRDFVKGVLFHIVADHHAKKARQPRQMAPDAPEPGVDCAVAAAREEEFMRSWREDLMARGWAALRRHEEEHGQQFYAVLRLRAEMTQASSQDLAAELSTRLGKPITAPNLRKLLERARDKFGDLLIDEIADGLDVVNRQTVEEELIDLGILEQCRDALNRRWG